MTSDVAPIVSERLELLSLSPAFLEASLTGDLPQLGLLSGRVIPEDWLEAQGVAEMRLEQLRQDPTLQQWLLRGIYELASGTMVGHIGFHTSPGPAYLANLAPGAVEIGYTIYPSFRRRGYAREACNALMQWAAETHHVTSFILSISPENAPSLAIAKHFGFHKIGSQIDDEDGPEDIFLRRIPAM